MNMNPEDLFEFNASPFLEAFNALPSPNICITTPTEEQKSQREVFFQTQHVQEERLSPEREKATDVREFDVAKIAHHTFCLDE